MMSIKMRLENAFRRPAIKPQKITGLDLSRTMKQHWFREHDIVLSSHMKERTIIVEVLPTYYGHIDSQFENHEDYIAYLTDMSYLINSYCVGGELLEKMQKEELAPYIGFLPLSKRPVKIPLHF